jgi:hypothetical protein
MVVVLLGLTLVPGALPLPLSPVTTARASDDGGWMNGGDLRRMISGNTMTGRHDVTGMPYSEYHLPDGRVFGHNNWDPVDQGCWDVRDNMICYYYAGGKVKGEFCWRFRQVTATGFRLELPATGTLATGILARGNPYNFSDNGKPWVCEPLMSRNSTPREDTRLTAR